VRILKNEARLLGRSPYFIIYDNDDSLSLIKQILKEMNVSKESYAPTKIQWKIGNIKNELLDPEEHLDKIHLAAFLKYEGALAKNNAFDFDDLIEKPVKIFQEHPEILKKYQDQFLHILVDEYQDVNTSQYQFIKLLAQKHKNICVVGDDAQSIYRFRGSDFRNFLNFEEDWPNAKVVKLEQNYRSTPTIIQGASAIIKNNKMQKPKDLWTKNPDGDLIKVARAISPEQEAEFVARQILSTNNKSNANKRIYTTAVLYRTNAQSRAVEQALIANQIPYKIYGGLKFYERKEIKDVISGLRFSFNPRDTVSQERLEKTFAKKISGPLLSELPRLKEKLNILELISFFLENTNYFDYLDSKFNNVRERIENINELIQFAGTFNNLGEFLERVSLLQSTDRISSSANNESIVNLMSIHLSKGLEFDIVFVAGCGEGLMPHQMSYGSLDELEEERRLMYVAMTRAKKKLFLSFSHTPSRFIYEIPSELTEFVDLTGGRGELPNEEETWIDYE
ncbi:MAG: 3'-5' exonuclease, partial [Patescibacteria group bacterium]